MSIPVVIRERRMVELSHPLGEPGWYDKCREGVGDNHVGISVEHVGAPLRLISQPLEVNRGDGATQLHCCLNLDDVGELMRYDISDPGVSSSELEVKSRSPQLDLVIIEIGRAVREIVVVVDNQAHLRVGLVLVQTRNRAVHFLCS